MGKFEQRILKKLDEWAAEGLITVEQAEAIRAREPAPKSSPPWGILIFAGFGAVVLGLGVILMFAYNWDDMHKFAKLAVVFGALLGAHGTGMILRRKNHPEGFSDSAFLTGTMLFGAGIWLVAQIYHISAHYPNAFIVWAVGALMLAWILPSISHGLLASILISIWACCEAVSYDNHTVVAPLLIVAGTGWLAWRLRSPVLLAGVSVSFVVTTVVGLAFDWECAMPLLLCAALLLASVSWITRDHRDFPSASRVLGVIGTILYLPLLFILTFDDAVDDTLPDFYRFHGYPSLSEWLPAVLLIVAAFGFTGVASYRAAAEKRLITPEFRNQVLAPLFIATTYLIAWGTIMPNASQFFDKQAVSIVICIIANVIFIYHMVASLWTGCRDIVLRRVVVGSLMLAVWIFARFADLFDSLLARGAMFIVMGAALFAVAVIYHRKKKKVSITLNPGKES